MSLLRFLTSRIFLKNLGIAVILLAILSFISLKGLEKYTLHGQIKQVPDFTGMLPDEAQKIAVRNNIRTEIIDSLFLDDAAPGAVVDQIPRPGHGVKQNRKIFLTINATNPEIITLPKLTDISYRQALAIIENSGLKTGKISYKPSEFDNLVLAMQIDSVDVKPGKKIPKGTKIELVIGRKAGHHTSYLPALTGLTIIEAKEVLEAALLNTGVVIYDETVFSKEDSVNIRVWKQRPDPETTTSISAGSSVDIWVTADSLKFEEPEEFH